MSVNRQFSTLSIANTTIPLQNQAWQSIANPTPDEMSTNYWRFDPPREGDGFQASFEPSDQQTGNFFSLNEGHQSIKNGMFERLTGDEPIFGHINYMLNPLDDNSTNAVPNEFQGQTRVKFNMNPARPMFKPGFMYPHNRGQPDFMNFMGNGQF